MADYGLNEESTLKIIVVVLMVFGCFACGEETKPIQSTETPGNLLTTQKSALITLDEYKYIHFLISQAKAQAIKQAVQQCAKKPGPMGQQCPKGDPGPVGPQGEIGPTGPKGDPHVYSCPSGATPVELNDQIVYCYRFLDGQYLWNECFKECTQFGLVIVTLEGLAMGCLENPELYEFTIYHLAANSEHWVGPSRLDSQNSLPTIRPTSGCGQHLCKWINGIEEELPCLSSFGGQSSVKASAGCICGSEPR